MTHHVVVNDDCYCSLLQKSKGRYTEDEDKVTHEWLVYKRFNLVYSVA